MESTEARVHVRWNYQSCDFNYRVNGDLAVEDRSVSITVRPAGWCMNPVFELQGAPKALLSVELAGQTLDRKQYAWDGATLWLNAELDRPTPMRLELDRDKPGP